MFAKISSILAVVLWLSLGLAGGTVNAQEPAESDARSQPLQERSDDLRTASLSFIDSPTPTCYRSLSQSNTCFINWSHIAVSTGSPQTIISMTVTIDDQLRANYQGYFQSSVHVSSAFHGDGFQVVCGPLSGDGDASLGYAYDWTIKARDSGGQETSNFGAVTCPAPDLTHLFLPLILKQ